MRNPQDKTDPRFLDRRTLPQTHSTPIIPGTNHQRTFIHNIEQDKTLHAMQLQMQRLRHENNMFRKRFDSQGEMHEMNTDQDYSQKSNVFTDMGDKKTQLNNRYNKALREITKLLKINRQLKAQLNNVKREGSNSGNVHQAIMDQDFDELKFKCQELEAHVRELESTNNLYSGQLTQYEGQIQHMRMQFEDELRQVTNTYQQRIAGLQNKFDNIEGQLDKPNEMVFDLKLSLQRYKKQQVIWQEEKRSFYEQILRLQNSVEQSRLDKDKLMEEMQINTEQINTKFRRELQQEIFHYKSQNNNLKQTVEMLSAENERLTRQLKYSLSTKAEKHQDETKVIWELNCQIENFISEIGGLREAIEEKERIEAEMQILKSDNMNINHNCQLLSGQNDYLQKRLEEKQAEVVNLMKNTRKLSAAASVIIPQAKNHIHLTKEKQQITEELRSLRAQVDHLKGQNHILYRQIEQAQLQMMDEIIQENHPAEERPLSDLKNNTKILFLQNKLKEFKFKIDLVHSMKSKEHGLHKQVGMMKIILNEITSSMGVIVSENMQAHTKLKRYREKLGIYKHKMGSSSKDNKKLLEKIKSYDELVVKFEHELENCYLKLNSNTGFLIKTKQKKTFRYSDLEQKLELQGKGFDQEIQTKILEYEAKLLQKKIENDHLKEQTNSFELYKTKIKEMASKILELENLNSQYWSQINKASFQYSDHNTKSLGSQNTEIVALIEKLTEKDNKIINLEFKVSRVNDLLSHAENRIKDLEYTIESGAEDYNQLRNKLTQLQMSNDNLRQEISLYEIKLRNNDNIKSMRSIIAPEIDGYVSVRQSEITQLKNMLKRLTEANHNLEYELNNTKRNMVEKQEQSRHIVEDNAELKSKLDDTNYRLQKLKKQQIQLNSVLASERQTMEYNQTRQRTNLNELRNRIDASQAEVTRLRQVQNQSLNNKYEVTNLKSQSTKLQDRIMMLESQLLHYNQLTAKQTTQTQKYYEKDLELELEMHSLKQAKERHEKIEQNLSNEINELNRGFAHERKQLLEQINVLRNQLIKLEQAKRELEYQVQGTSSNYTAKLNNALQTNSRLEEQNQSLKRRINDIEREKLAEIQKISLLESENYKLAHLSRQTQRLHQLLKSREQQLRLITVKLAESERHNQQEISDLKQANFKLQHQHQKNAHIVTELDRVTKLNKEFERDLKDLRLRYSGDNYYQQRLKQNLGLFVLLFVEIESLRGQIKAKNTEMEQSRRSSIAIAAKLNDDTGSASPFHQHRIQETLHHNIMAPSAIGANYVSESPLALYSYQPTEVSNPTSESRILGGQPIGLEFRAKSRSRGKKAASSTQS